jgi:hypothetical protein
MLIAAIGIAIIACASFWIVGGVLLRAAGLIIAALAALNLAIAGDPAAILLFVVGLALWLGGHWHYALRHHVYKSPLARRIFYQVLPRRLDPTRGWGIPVVPVESQQESPPDM